MVFKLIPMPNVIKPGRSPRTISGTATLLVVIGACFCFHFRLGAQTFASPTMETGSQSWTATTDSKGDYLAPERRPVRIIESHSENGKRRLDKRSVEIRGTDGHFEPYQDIECETVQVDDNKVRTTTRTFGRDVNKAKTLVQVTEEEQRTQPDGDSTTVKITANPDANGRVQISERDTVHSRRIADDVQEIQTTVELVSINGDLAPAVKTREIRKGTAGDPVQSEKTTLLPDGGGNWQVNETRQTTSRSEGGSRVTEERISRLDAEGKLSEISRTVTSESENSAGEKRSTVETYSKDVPGSTRDGNLHLIERVNTSSQGNARGAQTSEQKIEQINAGDPAAGLRVSVLVNNQMVAGPSGEQSSVTIRSRDFNGGFSMVSVDTKKSDRSPAVDVQQAPSDHPR